MKYLLDTHVISEIVCTKPNQNVLTWLKTLPMQAIFLSVLTLGEIRKGIEKVSDNKRKTKLILWLENDLAEKFASKIISITPDIADRWGRLQAEVKRTLPAIDSLIAATALHYDMILVTRNVSDFNDCPGLQLFNPWENNTG